MRNPIDIDGFKSIGLVKFYFNFEYEDEGWKDAYFEIYLPKQISFRRGDMYCFRFVFLDQELAIDSFQLEEYNIKIKEDEEGLSINGIKVIMSDRQLEKVKELASREIPRVKEDKSE